MKTFNNTRELLQAWPGLDNDVREALLGACSTRGKWAGFMLNNAPNVARRAHRAAWQAMLAEVAPARMSIWGILTMPDTMRELFDRISFALAGDLGTALQAQEPAFRWSLFAHHNDVDLIQAQAWGICETAAREAAGQGRLFD